MKLDLSTRINNAIRKIQQDIINGVIQGNMLDGRPFTPNAESTEKQKGFNKRLVGKKNTFTSKWKYKINSATAAKQEATLTFANRQDAKIALYNQKPTGKGTIKEKDAAIFWGISERVLKETDKEDDEYINRLIDKEFQRSGFKRV